MIVDLSVSSLYRAFAMNAHPSGRKIEWFTSEHCPKTRCTNDLQQWTWHPAMDAVQIIFSKFIAAVQGSMCSKLQSTSIKMQGLRTKCVAPEVHDEALASPSVLLIEWLVSWRWKLHWLKLHNHIREACRFSERIPWNWWAPQAGSTSDEVVGRDVPSPLCAPMLSRASASSVRSGLNGICPKQALLLDFWNTFSSQLKYNDAVDKSLSSLSHVNISIKWETWGLQHVSSDWVHAECLKRTSVLATDADQVVEKVLVMPFNTLCWRCAFDTLCWRCALPFCVMSKLKFKQQGLTKKSSLLELLDVISQMSPQDVFAGLLLPIRFSGADCHEKAVYTWNAMVGQFAVSRALRNNVGLHLTWWSQTADAPSSELSALVFICAVPQEASSIAALNYKLCSHDSAPDVRARRPQTTACDP